MADTGVITGVLNRSLQWFSNVGQTFDDQLLRQNAGDQYLVDTIRLGNKLMDWSTIAVIVQALLGSDPSLQQNIGAMRSIGAQPQSGGGPGQPVSYPIQQPLPSPAAPAAQVYAINPTTGTISRAS
jgi:hypothetical protein